MAVIELARAQAAPDLDTPSMSWWDADAECTVTIARPSDDEALWEAYLAGAQRSYRRQGIAAAVDVEAIRGAADTTLFWTMVDTKERVVGGIRAVGPLTTADEAHAVVEWAGQPGLPLVRKMIADRLPFGVVEMKTAWVTDDRDRNRKLTATLARTGCHVLAALGVQFCFATCAAVAMQRWRSSGGVVAPVEATPYPDERFRTTMMWWDRRTVASCAAATQTAKIAAEMEHIRRRRNTTNRLVPVGS
jgi:hypothetical protein